MKSVKITTHQYYRQSLINKEKLKESLPYCVRIQSSNEDERDDIITLEFDRENCIPLNEVIKYTNITLLRLTHGQIFNIVYQILSLIENPLYQNLSIYNIWLIFQKDNPERFKLNCRNKVDFLLFCPSPSISQPQQDQTQQDQSQIKDLIRQVLTVCKNIESSYFLFGSNKPHNKFLKELDQEFNQFKKAFKEYYENDKNINKQTQMDTNIDPEDEHHEEEEDLKKIKEFNKIYIQESKSQNPLEEIVNRLLKQYEFELNLKSLTLFKEKDRENINYNLKNIKRIFKFTKESELIQFIEKTFEELNQEQEILKQDILYNSYQLKQDDLEKLYYAAAITYLKHQGYFNSFDQFNQILQKYYNKEPLSLVKESTYIFQPIIKEYYDEIVFIKILELIDDLI